MWWLELIARRLGWSGGVDGEFADPAPGPSTLVRLLHAVRTLRPRSGLV